ncbi:MAG TPA: LpqB family beta-propeller domain-containing protein [Solirubrobacterales bacterium]
MTARSGIRPIHLLPAALVALLAVGLCLPALSRAAFGPIKLISKSAREQAALAAEPAFSADGQYVAFFARLGGREGIFREELATGALELVAAGANVTAPSISEEGRYVTFTTPEALVPADAEANTNEVYVADTSASPPTYELVSVASESEEPLPGGSLAAGQVAMSSAGTRVAFVNKGNVYVRDLTTKETILISARRDPLTGTTEEPVVGGGAYEPVGAAISADGSTVAWVGEHLPEQVPLLGDEEAAIKRIEEEGGSTQLESQYHEPLWRRIPSPTDSSTQTRRVVGGGDPSAPGCPAAGSLTEAACQGPYPEVSQQRQQPVQEENGWGWGIKLPRLDTDGDVVALAGDPDEQYDLFVVDMDAGLDRDQAVRQITKWTNPVPQNLTVSLSVLLSPSAAPEYWPFTGAVTGCAISPDGTRVAFTTTRQRFSLAPFALISEIPAAISLIPELYELNLEGDTIERATPGEGQVVSEEEANSFIGAKEGAAAPSFGADGHLIAFSSSADNLVAGDGNGRRDVFVVESSPPTPIGTDTISPRPPQTVTTPIWRMTANAFSLPDGNVRILARVPGPGKVRASARSQLGTKLKSRSVAKGQRRAKVAGAVILDLKLGKGRRSMAHKPGLVARVHLTFSGPGGKPLQADLQSRFEIHRKRAAKHKKGSKR